MPEATDHVHLRSRAVDLRIPEVAFAVDVELFPDKPLLVPPAPFVLARPSFRLHVGPWLRHCYIFVASLIVVMKLTGLGTDKNV